MKLKKLTYEALKTIPLTQNKESLIDDYMSPIIGNKKWYAFKNRTAGFYAVRAFAMEPGRKGRKRTEQKITSTRFHTKL